MGQWSQAHGRGNLSLARTGAGNRLVGGQAREQRYSLRRRGRMATGMRKARRWKKMNGHELRKATRETARGVDRGVIRHLRSYLRRKSKNDLSSKSLILLVGAPGLEPGTR